MRKTRLSILLSLLAAVTILASACARTNAEPKAETAETGVKVIDYEEYRNLIENKETFVVDIARISCPFCSVVYYLHDKIDSKNLPVYYLDLEKYYNMPAYEEHKGELGITYVPTFFYVENGEVKYTMNNPLDEAYYDENVTGDTRMELQKKALDKINAFIAGAAGEGEVINEELMNDTIIATPEDKS